MGHMVNIKTYTWYIFNHFHQQYLVLPGIINYGPPKCWHCAVLLLLNTYMYFNIYLVYLCVVQIWPVLQASRRYPAKRVLVCAVSSILERYKLGGHKTRGNFSVPCYAVGRVDNAAPLSRYWVRQTSYIYTFYCKIR